MTKTSKIAKILLTIVGMTLVILAVGIFYLSVEAKNEPKGKIEREVSIDAYDDYFDPYDGGERERHLYFNLISEPFAGFSLSKKDNICFAINMDEESCFAYLICLTDKQFDAFKDIYDYTYSDDPDISSNYGTLRGYPVPIDDDLREMAIEFFEEFWAPDILTEDNFDDIIGEYYLDATYAPAAVSENKYDPSELTVAAAIMLAVGLVCLVLAGRKRRYAPVDMADTTNAPRTRLRDESDFGIGIADPPDKDLWDR